VTPTETIAVPVWSSISAGQAASLRALAARWERVVLEPVDISFLVTFRVALGLLLAISMERFLAYGWVDSLLLEPTFRFKYFGFDWVEPLSRPYMFALFRAMVGLGCCVAAGFCFRASAILLALGLSYIQLIDVSTYLNHYYLAALLAWILAFSPAHRALSVDAWLRRSWARASGQEGPATVSHVPRAFLWLFRLQIGLVYFCAGLAKLQSDWLVHAQPLRIWLGASTDLPLLGRMLTWPGAPLVMSWVGFLFDATIVLWLCWSRSRLYAYVVVVVFHTLTRLLFDIGMFPWIMSACALIFFPPDAARRLVGRPSAARPADSVRPPSPAVRAALVLGLVYATVQVVLPFRHLAYGGNVLWHEQGMRFSWRVMVRAKGGAVSFLVRVPDREQPIVADPKQYLTAFQENEMAGQPDLILQMAHHIGRMYEARRPGPAEVYATTQISLNGRRPTPLVDPGVDLMKVRDGLRPASWILPGPTADPPHIVPVL